MSEEELVKHCNKQINLCLVLNDNKHLSEHQLILDIIKQKNNLKQVLNKIKEYIYINRKEWKNYNHDEADWLYIQDKEILQIIDKVLGGEAK